MYDEAIKNNLPILQVADIKGYEEGMKSMKEQGISTNAYLLSSHGNDGYFKIGNDRLIWDDDKKMIDKDVSGLKDGLKGKNFCIAACLVTSGLKGQEMISNLAKITKSVVYASDHTTSGLLNLNGNRWPYISYTGSGRLPFDFNRGGNGFNDFHMSRYGSTAKRIFDVVIFPRSGYIGTTATDFHR